MLSSDDFVVCEVPAVAQSTRCVFLLQGLEFPLSTWFSLPHLARISMQTYVPKPLQPANEGLRQTDPNDTQTNAVRWTAHGNASHVPWGECKTSRLEQHLHIWAADVPSADGKRLQYSSAYVLGCLCLWATASVRVYTGSTLHICVLWNDCAYVLLCM